MAQAIRKELSVIDFARWIMANNWNMHQDSSESAVELASEIQFLLDERDNFSLSDAAFLDELDTLNKALNVKVVSIRQAAPQKVYVFRPISSSYRDLPQFFVQA